MPIAVVFNGTSYDIPQSQEVGWSSLTNFLVDVAENAQTTTSLKNNLRVASTTPVTVLDTDFTVVVDLAVPGPATVNLPIGDPGRLFAIIDGSGTATTNNITVVPNGVETINGAANFVINSNRGGILIQFNEADAGWNILANFEVGGLTRTSVDQGANRVFNKDFDDATTKIVDSSDTTKKIAFEVAGNTTAVTTTIASTSTATATLSLPPATSTLLSRISTDTGANRLKNKDLEDATVNFVDESDPTKKLAFELSGITTATTRTLTVPDASTTILGNDNSAIVSNKTLDNTNIITVQDSNLTIQDNGDNTKQAQFQLSGLTTATTRTYAVPDANTTMLGTDAAQVVTNKDIDGGAASNTLRLTVPKNTAATLTGLTRKQATLVYDTTNNLLKYDDGSNLNTIGTASTASPTVQGLVTSFFPTIASSTNAVSSANYSVLTTDGYAAILVSTANSNRTIDLPAIASNIGRKLIVMKTDTGTGTVIIDPNASETINGATTYTLKAQYDFVVLEGGAAGWFIVASSLDPQMMSDIVATRLGLKAYSHGTTYSGGNAPTITLQAGGGTLSAITYSRFYPKQLQDGSWVLSGNFRAQVSSAGRTTAIFDVAGNTGFSFESAIYGMEADTAANQQGSYTSTASATTFRLVTLHQSATTTGYVITFTDLPILAKPNWAYS